MVALGKLTRVHGWLTRYYLSRHRFAFQISIYKIIWILHAFWLVYKCVFHSAMKHVNDVSNAVWLSPSCENLQHAGSSYIVFLFVKTENDNFIKEIKHVVRASIAYWKPRQSLREFSSRWKSSTVFTDLLSNFPQRLPRFSPGYEGTENMFIS